MKTIDYKILSEEWGSVQLPQEALEKTKKLIDDLHQSKSGMDLLNFADEHIYLFNTEILNLAKEYMACTPDTKKEMELKDRLLLSICVYGLDRLHDFNLYELKKQYTEAEIQINEKYKDIIEPIVKIMKKFELKNSIPNN
jgi:hypothetical protein